MIDWILGKIGDFLFSILEKKFGDRFSREIKTSPQKIIFLKSDWIQTKSFCVYNKSNEVLYDIYFLILDEVGDLLDIKITYKKHDKSNSISVGDYEVNRDLFQLIGSGKDKDKIILSIYKIEPNSYTEVFIESKNSHKIIIKLLKYSKESQPTVRKDGSVAFPFEIPDKLNSKNRNFETNGLKLGMKRK